MAARKLARATLGALAHEGAEVVAAAPGVGVAVSVAVAVAVAEVLCSIPTAKQGVVTSKRVREEVPA